MEAEIFRKKYSVAPKKKSRKKVKRKDQSKPLSNLHYFVYLISQIIWYMYLQQSSVERENAEA